MRISPLVDLIQWRNALAAMLQARVQPDIVGASCRYLMGIIGVAYGVARSLERER
jgi:hypothetical protein